jgi:alanine racemase
MDQTVVEVGPAGDPSVVPVQQGDEVVLLGSQTGPGGTDRITASEWAERIGTIPYEVVCGFGARLPRTYP